MRLPKNAKKQVNIMLLLTAVAGLVIGAFIPDTYNPGVLIKKMMGKGGNQPQQPQATAVK